MKSAKKTRQARGGGSDPKGPVRRRAHARTGHHACTCGRVWTRASLGRVGWGGGGHPVMCDDCPTPVSRCCSPPRPYIRTKPLLFSQEAADEEWDAHALSPASKGVQREVSRRHVAAHCTCAPRPVTAGSLARWQREHALPPRCSCGGASVSSCGHHPVTRCAPTPRARRGRRGRGRRRRTRRRRRLQPTAASAVPAHQRQCCPHPSAGGASSWDSPPPGSGGSYPAIAGSQRVRRRWGGAGQRGWGHWCREKAMG